jgi:hypothetical protein
MEYTGKCRGGTSTAVYADKLAEEAQDLFPKPLIPEKNSLHYNNVHVHD